MARPKGGTLTALFAVSEKERKEFWERQERIRQQSEAGSLPSGDGGPVLVSESASGAAAAVRAAEAELTVPENGIPESGTPSSGIPETGVPETSAPETGGPKTGIPEMGVPVSKPAPLARLRQAVQAQDGHSLGEQAVYRALWDSAKGYQDDCRIITIGYRTLSSLCGLTVNNCKANLQALQKKLSIAAASGFSATVGTTYKVYSYAAILQRRREAGLTHYIKSRGVTFVNPETGIPVSGIPETESGVPEKGTPKMQSGIPVSDESGAPFSSTHLRNTERKATSSSSEIAGALWRFTGEDQDDDGISQIRKACQATWPEITDSEIAALIERKLSMRPPIKSSLIGFLSTALPKMRRD